MKKENNINKQVAETMDVLERINEVEVNPFLYEKTLNKMQQTKETVFKGSLLLRRSFVAVMILFVINTFSFVYLSKSTTIKETKTSAAKELISVYNLDESSNNY